MELSFETVLATVFAILFVVFLAMWGWMKFRQLVSKAKFAFFTLSSIIICLSLGLSALTTSLPSILVELFARKLGIVDLPSYSTTVSQVGVVALTLLAIWAIWHFAHHAISSWNAPPRMSEFELSQSFQQDSIAMLSLKYLKVLFEGREDAFASEDALTWEQRSPEVPKAIPNSVLLRDLFCASMKEAIIKDDGWRDRYKLWSGEVYQPLSNATENLTLLVFDTDPLKDDVIERLSLISDYFTENVKYNVYGVYFDRNATAGAKKKFIVGGIIVEVLSSRNLIVDALDLKSYARDLIKQFESTKVGGLDVTVADSFVPLSVEADENPAVTYGLDDLLAQWSSENSNRHISITGEYGQGKSTAMLKYCVDWAKRFIESGDVEGRVPLLIELRSKNPGETDPLSFLSAWCSRYRLQPAQVYNLIRSGDAIVIFEGFDELKNSGRSFDRYEHFSALWRFAFPNTKIIFTGRPNFFLNDREANRTLRSSNTVQAVGAPYSEVWCLKKMTHSQLGCACRAFPTRIRLGIETAAAQNADFFEIVSRPSMLPVVATIWDEIHALTSSGVALTGAILVEKYLDAIFARKEAELERDKREYDAPQGARYLVLHRSVRELLTICVALRMAALGGSNTISRQEIVEMTRDLYPRLKDLCLAAGVQKEVLNSFMSFEKQTLDDTPSDKIQIVVSDICSAGILIPDPVGGVNNLRFPHKQFFEYLVAKGGVIGLQFKKHPMTELLQLAAGRQTICGAMLKEPNSIKYFSECVEGNIPYGFYSYGQLFWKFLLLFTSIITKVEECAVNVFSKRKMNGHVPSELAFYVIDNDILLRHHGNRFFAMLLFSIFVTYTLVFYFGFEPGFVNVLDRFEQVIGASLLAFALFVYAALGVVTVFLTPIFVRGGPRRLSAMAGYSKKLRFSIAFLLCKLSIEGDAPISLGGLLRKMYSSLSLGKVVVVGNYKVNSSFKSPHTALIEEFVDIETHIK
ncbi:NACHT domain-containing protein [Thalassospira povalilytica]|uniref:NACHT domain-containing protein n=1 Tax=Thalassospira povalilytica TaxID=732237 RepID=A0A8I1MB40_9PROT|nr:hypothetical protein [Thalassospira povalilytica]MBN8198602.1 hypothetical protein [Thalassospira povalilytica]